MENKQLHSIVVEQEHRDFYVMLFNFKRRRARIKPAFRQTIVKRNMSVVLGQPRYMGA